MEVLVTKLKEVEVIKILNKTFKTNRAQSSTKKQLKMNNIYMITNSKTQTNEQTKETCIRRSHGLNAMAPASPHPEQNLLQRLPKFSISDKIGRKLQSQRETDSNWTLVMFFVFVCFGSLGFFF